MTVFAMIVFAIHLFVMSINKACFEIGKEVNIQTHLREEGCKSHYSGEFQ